MQRLQAVKPVEKPAHIRPAPTQCSRCWGAYWWCCASPRPGSAPHKWFSSRSSPSPVPFSSHGSAPTGTFSSSRSTTLGTWPLPEKNRRPFRNSGEVSMNESMFGQEVQQKLTGNLLYTYQRDSSPRAGMGNSALSCSLALQPNTSDCNFLVLLKILVQLLGMYDWGWS